MSEDSIYIPPPITGYRSLSQREVDDMNKVKELGQQLRIQIDAMKINGTFDGRWISIGETHLQQGIMALVRAIARPTSF